MIKLLRLIDRNAERYLLLVFYLFIVLTVTSEVLRRFLLSYSSVWGEEAARFAFIYLAWIGAAAAVKERAHLRIDILLQMAPAGLQRALYVFGDVMTLLLAVIALIYSWGPLETSLRYGSVTAGLRVSEAWFLAAVPLGFSLMIFRVLQALVQDWRDFRAGRPVQQSGQMVK
ncbi:TRAP transporter small permease [Spiribacter halobius]|uniref:TRAP transporter small permease protein n=1 Tax=Sediminicurvatus halobius TaxID=2182432 RepID=A0A2U2N5Q4_9GAMM|nr:TRAP transporter small permease [Spiribacter halobius]PWG64531.1 TRAP transporter permease DctQ [Spiribacter halobius]UEX79146.1 TRAP transporter small permease [Spiribacter halobius]